MDDTNSAAQQRARGIGMAMICLGLAPVLPPLPRLPTRAPRVCRCGAVFTPRRAGHRRCDDCHRVRRRGG